MLHGISNVLGSQQRVTQYVSTKISAIPYVCHLLQTITRDSHRATKLLDDICATTTSSSRVVIRVERI